MTLVVAEVGGSAHAMGRAYGEAAGEQIAAALRYYDGIIPGGAGAVTGRTTPYIDVARRVVPHLVEEMEGIAEGAGATFEEIAALNCLEEVYDFEACTSLASGRFLLHAEQWYAGHTGVAVVVARPETGPTFVSPTCAGFLPVVGMNSCGIAQGVDSLHTTDDRVGVPRVLVSRHVLSATTIARAQRAAALAERAGGYAYVLATADERLVVETSATRAATFEDGHAHTNHPLTDEMTPVSRQVGGGSVARLVRALELTDRPLASVSDCMSVLSDHVGGRQAICFHGETATDSATIFGMICDLANGTVYVSDGPPCDGRWHTFNVPSFAVREAQRVG